LPEEKVLSEREEQILRLVATGMTNREIAQELTISPNTVKVHLSNVFEKIGVASRTEATLYGIEHGIVAVPGNGNQGAVGEPAEESFWKKYLWVWVPSLVVLVALLVYIMFGTDLIFPQPSTTPAGVQSLAEIEDRWVELAPMPEPRTGLAGTAYDGKVYAIAGEGPEGVSGSVFRYIPDEDRWESLRDKPTPVRDVQAVLIGEKIYVPGGELAVGRPTDILEIYDPRANTWEQGAPLPQPISAYALADYEGQMYLFGGWDGEKALDVVYIYDPDEDAWREGTPMPTARYHAGAGVSEGRILVLGGKNEEGALKDTGVYFPSRDKGIEQAWEANEDLPNARYDFGIASIYNSIYILGGYVDGLQNRESEGLVNGDEGWVDFIPITDFSNRSIEMISLGSQLVIIDSISLTETTQVWRYQAFYYSIFIPFVQD
jgi:DNA-binding CsgD family transcriptional regulator